MATNLDVIQTFDSRQLEAVVIDQKEMCSSSNVTEEELERTYLVYCRLYLEYSFTSNS